MSPSSDPEGLKYSPKNTEVGLMYWDYEQYISTSEAYTRNSTSPAKPVKMCMKIITEKQHKKQQSQSNRKPMVVEVKIPYSKYRNI